MPQFDFTFQESSPLISYSTGWDAIYDHNDPFKGSYTGIFRPTSKPDTTATLSFYGTGVSIFGAKRDNHGHYSVVLDNSPPVMGDGFANPYIFNTSLWSANGLPLSQHTVTLTNKPTDSSRNFVDIDFITIQRSIGGPDDTIHNLTLDNTAEFPSVNYTGSWQQIPQGSAYNHSFHRTAAAGAQAILQFRGCCIEVYGQYANADFTAVVDDQKPVTLRGFDVDLSDADQQPQTLLYLVDNLDEDKVHKVTLTNLVQADFRPLYFDYALVRSTKSISPVQDTNSISQGDSASTPSSTPKANSSLPGNSTSTPSSTPKADSQSRPEHVQVVAIVAAILGTVALGRISLFVYYLIRRRKKSSGMKTSPSNLQAQPYILPHITAAHMSSSSSPTTGPRFNNHNQNNKASSNLSIRGPAAQGDNQPSSHSHLPPAYESTWNAS